MRALELELESCDQIPVFQVRPQNRLEPSSAHGRSLAWHRDALLEKEVSKGLAKD